MAEWGHKTRYSIAAFRSLGELDAAVNALLAAGFVDDQIELAAAETVLPSDKGGEPDGENGPSPHLKALIDRFVPAKYLVTGTKILVSEAVSGHLAECLAATDDRVPVQGHLAVTRTKVLSQVYSGAWLLGTNALSYEQLRRGTRILLAHSSDRVETFEIQGS